MRICVNLFSKTEQMYRNNIKPLTVSQIKLIKTTELAKIFDCTPKQVTNVLKREKPLKTLLQFKIYNSALQIIEVYDKIKRNSEDV